MGERFCYTYVIRNEENKNTKPQIKKQELGLRPTAVAEKAERKLK
jgi:hypothetical protein